MTLTVLFATLTVSFATFVVFFNTTFTVLFTTFTVLFTTDCVGENFQRCALFFGKNKKTKTFLDQKMPQTIIRGVQVVEGKG